MFQLKDFCALDQKLAAKLLVKDYAKGAKALADLKVTEQQIEEACKLHQAEMIFPECVSYPLGCAYIGTELSVIREAILSKNGLVGDKELEDFRK